MMRYDPDRQPDAQAGPAELVRADNPHEVIPEITLQSLANRLRS